MVDGRCFEFKFLHAFLVLLFLLHMNNPSIGCIEREREALLAFKQGVVETDNQLSSWRSSEVQNEDCCTWKGVKCNLTGHVIELQLGFQSLQGSVPDVWGNLSSLRVLNLHENQLKGGFPNSFSKLCSLQTLILSSNNLTGQFSELVQMLSKCAQNSLELLSLNDNRLSGSIPESIEKMARLTYLHISRTQLSGRLPESIGNIPLKELSLYGNRLSGRLPESIGQMSKLVYLNLGMNSLEGEISETHFCQLSMLKTLDLSSNSLVLNVHSDWVPPFKLGNIVLGSCKIGPFFPKWLQTQNQSYLYLDLSNAGISDIIPSWFWDVFRGSDFVDLSQNQIRGTIENSRFEFAFYPRVNLSWNQLEGPIPSFLSKASSLDLSNNQFSGLTSFLCAIKASNLTFLDLSSNHVSGELPDCWRHLEKLLFLDLSNNGFSEKIPATMGYLVSIRTLKLNNNTFVGGLPSSLVNCRDLRVFDAGENKLSGSLPDWLGVRLENLIILILRSNRLHGSMPSQLCYLRHIQILDFSMNNISGTIPKCLKNWTALAQKGNSNRSITYNYLVKRGPGPLFIDSFDDEASLIWKGTMSKYKSTLGLVRSIHLSSNKLTGEIPSEIGYLVGLVSLNLSRNRLTGQLTPEIGKLQLLDSLDLSRNQMYGSIPTSFTQIHGLGVLDLSYNNLSGKIPIGTQLQSFDPSAYAGNPLLCGLPLEKNCSSPDKTGSNEPVVSDQEDKDAIITQGFYISIGLGFAVGFWGVFGTILLNRSCRHTYFNFLNECSNWLYVKASILGGKVCLIDKRYLVLSREGINPREQSVLDR